MPLRCSGEPHPLSRNHLARQGQVGVGVDPSLDDALNIAARSCGINIRRTINSKATCRSKVPPRFAPVATTVIQARMIPHLLGPKSRVSNVCGANSIGPSMARDDDRTRRPNARSIPIRMACLAPSEATEPGSPARLVRQIVLPAFQRQPRSPQVSPLACYTQEALRKSAPPFDRPCRISSWRTGRQWLSSLHPAAGHHIGNGRSRTGRTSRSPGASARRLATPPS